MIERIRSNPLSWTHASMQASPCPCGASSAALSNARKVSTACSAINRSRPVSFEKSIRLHVRFNPSYKPTRRARYTLEDRRFVGMGGPFQLGRIIDVFLSWAKSLPAPHDWLDTPDDVEMAARADRAFRDALGEEVGPEPCRHPGCDRNRIRHSVLCRKHHYEQVKGRPYDE